MKNPVKYEVAATNVLTGKAEYFGKEDMKQDDYRPVMASSAIPAACRPVEINGGPYYDGGIADAIPVRHAMEEGCSMDEDTERKLYDLGMKDFAERQEELRRFLAENSTAEKPA